MRIADNGSPVFHSLTHLDDSDLADLLQVIRVRLVNFLLRRGVMVLRPLLGVVEGRQELILLNDDFAEREPEWNLQRSGRFQVEGGSRRSSRKRGTREARSEPALTQLATAAVAGLLPAGPDVRQRQPIALRGQPGIEVTGALSVTEMGFSLHAATTASAEDARGREALVRYALRPPIAQERLHILPDNLVRIELKRRRRVKWCTHNGGHTDLPMDPGQSRSWDIDLTWQFITQF